MRLHVKQKNKESVNYNDTMIEAFNRGERLIWPTEPCMQLVALCIDTIKKLVQNKNDMKTFKEATVDRKESMECLKKIMKMCANKCSQLINIHVRYSSYQSMRKHAIAKHMLNTCFNIACENLSLHMNRLEIMSTISLSMVKSNAVKNNVNHKFSNNNEITNSGKWSIKKCKEFLTIINALLSGNVSSLRE